MSQRIDFIITLLTTNNSTEIVRAALKLIVSEIQSQEDLLNKISEDIKQIKESAYYAGLNFLKEADRRTTDVERLKDIEKARDRFIDALGSSQKDKFMQAVIKYNIAETYALLGEKRLSNEDFIESYRLAVEARKEIEERQRKVGEREATLVISTLGLAGVMTVGLTERQFNKTSSREREVLDFLRELKTLLKSIGVDINTLPAYEEGVHIMHIETAERIDRIINAIRRFFGGS